MLGPFYIRTISFILTTIYTVDNIKYMKTSKAQIKATEKYKKNNYARIGLYVKPDDKNWLQEKTKSINKYMVELIQKERNMENKTYINRSIYRELFNDVCADFSVYRLKHEIDDEFTYIEENLWEYREKSLFMDNSDVKEYDDFLIKAKAYLVKRELFK